RRGEQRAFPGVRALHAILNVGILCDSSSIELRAGSATLKEEGMIKRRFSRLPMPGALMAASLGLGWGQSAGASGAAGSGTPLPDFASGVSFGVVVSNDVRFRSVPSTRGAVLSVSERRHPRHGPFAVGHVRSEN